MDGGRHQTDCGAGFWWEAGNSRETGENESGESLVPTDRGRPESASMFQQKSPVASAALGAMVLVWVAAIVVPPAVLLGVRRGWLEQLDRPEAQQQWDQFRGDMKRQSGREGPVQRKVPKSGEPPLRVWLRDHVRLAIVAWVLFSGVLGAFFCLLVYGVVRGGP